MSSTPPVNKRRGKQLRTGFYKIFSSKSSSTIVADDASSKYGTGSSKESSTSIQAAPSSISTADRATTGSPSNLTSINASLPSVYPVILAHPIASPSKSSGPARDIGNAGFESLKTTLKLIQNSSDVFPPLKSTIAILLGVIELVEATFQNQQLRNDLQRKLESVVSIIQDHHSLSNSDAFNARLDGLVIAINNQLSALQIQNSRSFARRLAAGDESEQISSVYRTISYLFDAFQIDTALASERKVEEVQSYLWFDKLPQAEYAEYDARSPAQRHACTTNTRRAILAELIAWAADVSNTKIYWLNGMAGTGKTTITYTFSEILEKNQMLGATFFCYRQDNSGDAGLIFPTIARQLARRFPILFHTVVGVIRTDPQIGSRSVQKQFQDLIVKPLLAASRHLSPRPPVIVIEALDECTNRSFVADIISVVTQHASTLPVKFFISSRPERWIRQSFNRRGLEAPLKLVLHEVEKDVVSADIELYIKARLGDIADGRDDEGPFDNWPSEYDVKTLVDLAGNLFIYAATTCAYIAEGSIQERLSMVTNISTGTSRVATAALDALYGSILMATYAPANLKEKQDIKLTLRAVVSIFHPLSIKGLGELLDVSVTFSLSNLHSLIYIPSSPDSNIPISVLHTSFPDYISDKDRAGDELWLDPSDSHKSLALHCLSSMQVSLDKHIQHLRDRNREQIPESLRYACVYWALHITETLIEDRAEDAVYLRICEFFDKNTLKWIDCLSVLGQLKFAVTALTKLENWAQYMPIALRDITDARLFVLENFEYIKHHTLQANPAALVWLPAQSSIREKYSSGRNSQWKLILGARKTWHVCETVLVGHSSTVTSVAFCTNGTSMASGSDDKTVRIWNAMTGECEAILGGHSASVTSVVFSPDGSTIVSASDDQTVRIWNVVKGEYQAILRRHSDRVKSVAFSPDGSSIASGSYDNSIIIWNSMGKYRATLNGHSDRVKSVVFSPDTSRIASASDDKTVRIWNTSTGKCEAELRGHPASVNSVIFSPDGIYVASASDDNTVRIWNATTGKSERQLKNHNGWVNSVAYSPDGNRIATATYGNIVHVWKATTGESEAELKGHSASVNSVAFSPDGTRVASASYDNTVRIWNATMREYEVDQRHSSAVNIVLFSPDGDRIASVSEDNTAFLWNAMTGQFQVELKGHSDRINSLVFSPNGSYLASASDDNSVRIWDATTGKCETELKGHSASVNSIAFSLDGSRIASTSDRTIHVWSVMTGKSQVVLKGHLGHVTCVSFSPDGSRIASGSHDETVRVWNATTGKCEAQLKGHKRWIYSVAFSPDGLRIASASYDNTVRVWNAIAGESEAELKGHNARLDSIVFSADGSHLSAITNAGKTHIWNTTARKHEPSESSTSEESPLLESTIKHQLLVDDQWIHRVMDVNKETRVHRDFSKSCWIPPPFRNPRAIAYHGSKVCLGYQTGEVLALEVSYTPT